MPSRTDQAPFRGHHEQYASHSDGFVRPGRNGAHNRVLARAVLRRLSTIAASRDDREFGEEGNVFEILYTLRGRPEGLCQGDC